MCCGECESSSQLPCNPPVLQEDQTPAPEPQTGMGVRKAGITESLQRERWHVRTSGPASVGPVGGSQQA